MQGNVSVRRGDAGEMVAAVMNAPIGVSDRLMTGEGARAEVQLDWSNMLRLAPSTEVRFSELQDKQYQIQIATGMVTFRVLRDTNALAEISTPNVSIRPLKKGVYRIWVRPDGTTQVTVRSGEAEIFSPKGTEHLQAGRTMEARGSSADPEFQVVAAIQLDEWDRWNSERDRDIERSTSYNHVSPDVVGAEELDAHGRWVNDGEYGNVWVPTVDADWAP
jgi:ferric-dicitrate binding protein FerR (iron transport regulator)